MNRLASYREICGLKRADVVKHLAGVLSPAPTVADLRAWERGEAMPDPDSLETLVEFYGAIDADHLMDVEAETIAVDLTREQAYRASSALMREVESDLKALDSTRYGHSVNELTEGLTEILAGQMEGAT